MCIHAEYCWLLGISFIYAYEILETDQTVNGHLVQLFIKQIMLKKDENYHVITEISNSQCVNSQGKTVPELETPDTCDFKCVATRSVFQISRVPF